MAAILVLASFTPVSAQTHRGKATYYSKRATGARTASGERLHHDSMTCAHRSYPFGTKLKVTNLRNGKTVVVRVTDRGPFARGRIIDLSYGAARNIGMLSQGVAMVEVERVDETQVPYRDDNPEMSIPEIDIDVTDFDIKQLYTPKKAKPKAPPKHGVKVKIKGKSLHKK